MPKLDSIKTMVMIKSLGVTDFEATCRAMQAFTLARTPETQDEIWLTEHPPVYTLGLNKKNLRIPQQDAIPIVETDRGGKITYHGPGQAIIYVLIDLKRYALNIRQLVSMLEASVTDLLAAYQIPAFVLPNAPGVYVTHHQETAKIASLGLRIKNHYSYHGLSINVDMDLSPFNKIDPCGYAGLKVAQLKDLAIKISPSDVSHTLALSIGQALTKAQQGLCADASQEKE
jgi:lipoyl(octanoyl) transferase